jgi:hypothetical protein
MKLVIDLDGSRAQELHLSDDVARIQLRNVLQRHEARGHTVTRVADQAIELHYLVTTPEGPMRYWLEN